MKALERHQIHRLRSSTHAVSFVTMLLLATIPSTHADLESQACSNLTTGATDASGRAGAGNTEARSTACIAGRLQHNAAVQDGIMTGVYSLVAAGCYVACAFNTPMVCSLSMSGVSMLDRLVLSQILDRQNARAAETLSATTGEISSGASGAMTLATMFGGPLTAMNTEAIGTTGWTSTANGQAVGGTHMTGLGTALCYAQAGLATVTAISKGITAVMNENGSVDKFHEAQTLISSGGALTITPDAPTGGSHGPSGGTTTSAISGGARDARGNANPTVQPTGDGSVDHSQDLQIGTCLANPGGSGCSAVSAAMNSKDWPKGIDHPDFKKFTKDKFGKTPGELASTMYAQRDNPAGAIASAVEGVPGLSGSTKGAIGQVIGFHKSLYGELKGELASGYSRGSTASSGSPEDPNAQLQEALAGFAGQLGGGRPKKQNPASGNELAFRGASAPERAIAAEDRTVGIFDRIHWRYERTNLFHP